MLKQKGNTMRKVSKTHAVAINKLMLPLIKTVAYFDADENDLGMFKMYADDIAHNIAALCVFNSTLDASVLHDNIMRQDTLPREHFYEVLKYIEDNKLIPANAFCCR
jgi:hydroxymethylpyrimidine pyrophosphatase-like HAD family hydrolase